jgi:hypothetical protein
MTLHDLSFDELLRNVSASPIGFASLIEESCFEYEIGAARSAPERRAVIPRWVSLRNSNRRRALA